MWPGVVILTSLFSGSIGRGGWRERQSLGRAAECWALLCAGGGWQLVTMHAQMLLEGLLVAEALAAVGAGIGVLPRVHALVFQQVFPAGKGLEALAAAMPPLPIGMAGLVTDKGLGVAEALPALPARVHLCPGLVDAALVLDEVVRTHKAFVALSTAIRPLTSVDPVVVGQLGLLGKALLALRTLVGLLPCVGPCVVIQVLLSDESLVALWTLEGPGSFTVSFQMDHQARFAVEGLVAL